MIRYKILIEYLGSGLCGWQRQNNGIGVQQVIEEAISKFSNEAVTIYGAGRTDKGVHALGQVAHFDLVKYYDPVVVIKAINHFLREYHIRILDCTIVDSNFHARFSAKKRCYLYRIINRYSQIAIESDRVWWIKDKLDLSVMKSASHYLIGKHDFSSFKSSGCYTKRTVVNLERIDFTNYLDELRITFIAPFFFYRMIRNIIGTLVMVGVGKLLINDIVRILKARDRTQAGIVAPACGLYLLKIEY